MSGIVGFLNRDGAPADRRLLDRLNDFLAYRGPDAHHTWLDGAVGFGHTLLRTTWESAKEQQPCTVDGHVWITADVRVDAREDLIRELRAAGREPSQDVTDPELILHAYHAWNERCLDHLLGDFSFAIWDGRTGRLFCARDHLGIKLFYYSLAGGKFLFSNTLECLRLDPAVSAQLNDAAIADFLVYDNNQNLATTTFRDIQRLPAGHYLICSREHFQISQYWTLPIEAPIYYRRADEYVEHFRHLLGMAVGDRLRTGSAGIFMSGGLDSPGLAATACGIRSARSSPCDLRAYTVTYDWLIPDDERHYAGLVADALQIPIQFLAGDGYGLYERWDQPELQRPEPVNNPRGLPIVFDQLIQMSAHSRVAFYGEGPDNALYYEWQAYVLHLFKTFRWEQLIRDVSSHLRFHHELPLWKGMGNRFRRAPESAGQETHHTDWIRPEILKLATDVAERKSARMIHPFHPVAHAGLTGPLWDSIFENFDAGRTHTLVEVRHPYLDIRLLRYLLATPLIPWCRDKYLLRCAFQDALPVTVLQRPKTSLRRDPLLECVKSTGLPKWVPEPELFRYVDPDVVNTNLREYKSHLWESFRPISLNFFLAFRRSDRRQYEEGNHA